METGASAAGQLAGAGAGGASGGVGVGVLPVAVVFAVTVAGVLLRPRRVHEAWVAVAGAAAMGVWGAVGWSDLAAVLQETAPVLVFLAGVLVAGAVADRAGVFSLAALWTARATGSSARRLFVGVYVLGSVVTALFSLDATAVVLTPIVFHLVRHAGLAPLPFVFACTYAANTPSLVLPVSNLTNLLVQARFGLGFWEFARAMALPNLLAGGVGLGVLYGLFRGQLRGQLPVEQLELEVRALSRSPFLRWSACLLALMLAGFGLAGAAGWPLWPVALGGGAALAALALGRQEVRPRFFVRAVAWGLLPFVVGLFLVIRGVENAGLSRALLSAAVERPAQAAAHLVAGEAQPHPGPHETEVGGQPAAAAPWPRRVALAVAAALGSNLVNNIPMTLLGMGAVGQDRWAAYSLLLGVNLGPNLSIIGSLATMLALGLVRQRGVDVGGWSYLRVGLVAMPATLAAGLAGLWLAQRWWGGAP